MTWSSLSSFLLLCTTKVWVLSQLQSRNFKIINLHKIPCTKLFHLRRRLAKKLLAKADCLLDKTLSFPSIQLSNSQTLILDVVETGVFMLALAQPQWRKNADVPKIYFTWRRWCISDSDSESECQNQRERKLGPSQKLNIRNCKGCTHKVVLLMGLCATWWKLAICQYQTWDNFLHSKPSDTKFTVATRKFKQMKAFDGFKNEIWCMTVAYVDKLAKDFNGVKYLLLRQDLFDRTVDTKRRKPENSKETVRAFLTMDTKKTRPKKNCVDKWTEFAGEFRKLCRAEGIQIYSTLSETKAAFCCKCSTIPEKHTLRLHGRQ